MSPSTDQAVSVGQSVPVSWTVTDSSAFSTYASSWYDRVYAMAANSDGSAPAFDSSSATFLFQAYRDNSGANQLLANQSYTRGGTGDPQSVTFTTPGSYYLYVVTDYYNQQPESNEGNNTAVSLGKVVVSIRTNPVLSWTNPTDITYGTPLGTSQLNASASGVGGIPLAGSFTYTPASGTVLNAGQGQVLKVTFTPTDSTDYNTVTAQASLNVLKATPTVSLTDQGGSYTGNPFPVTAASVTGIAQDGTLATLSDPSLSYTYSVVGPGGALTPLSGPPSDTGSYQVVAHYAGSTNYTTADSLPVHFSITPDTTTQGNWLGVYGYDGSDVLGGTPQLPTYAQVTASGQSNWVWDYASTDARALEDPSTPGNRIAGAWYASKSFTVDVNLTDNPQQPHRVTVYLLDYDNRGRKEQVDLLDQNGHVLTSQTVANFSGGKYLGFTLQGHEKLRFTNLAGPNAVLSGLFFGPASAAPVPVFTSVSSAIFTAGVPSSFTLKAAAYSSVALSTSGALPSWLTFTDNHNGTATLTGTPPAGQASSSTLSLTATAAGLTTTQTLHLHVVDTATRGNWLGNSSTPVYGTQGYSLAQVGTNLPNPTASVSLSGQSNWAWDYASSNPSALQDPSNPGNRVAGTWYANKSFDVNVTFTDGNAHRVSLYLLDYDNRGRKEQVDMLDQYGQVLDSLTVANFSQGVYVGFTVPANTPVKFRVSNLRGPNAVLSGLFLDPAST